MTTDPEPEPQPQPQPTDVTTATAVAYIRVSTKDQAERGGQTEGFFIPARSNPSQSREHDSGDRGRIHRRR